MAQVLFRKYAPADYYDALIAGTKHTSEINPIAIKAMSHIGININKQKPKEVTEDMTRNATKYFLSLENKEKIENKEKNKHKNYSFGVKEISESFSITLGVTSSAVINRIKIYFKTE